MTLHRLLCLLGVHAWDVLLSDDRTRRVRRCLVCGDVSHERLVSNAGPGPDYSFWLRVR